MANSVTWSRVFAEGAVIVVSILLAFAIDAWWDARQELNLEREYLERLEADLASARERIGGYGERYGEVGEATRRLIGLLESGTPPADTVQFVALALMAGQTGYDREDVENLPQDYNKRIKSVLGEAPLLYVNGTLDITPDATDRILGTLLGGGAVLSELRHLNAELRRGSAFIYAISAVDDLLAQVTASRHASS